MVKHARKTGKRALAICMSILMLMSAWVFVAPSASAITSQSAGSYEYEIEIYSNSSDGFSNGFNGNWGECGNDHVGFDIHYATDNGRASSNSTYSYDLYSHGHIQKKVTTYASFTLSGFITGIYLGIDQDSILEDNTIEIKSIKVRKPTDGTWHTLWTGNMHVASSTAYHWCTLDFAGNINGDNNDHGRVKESSGGWSLPTPTCTYSGHSVVGLNGAQETRTYSVASAIDQYGVNWGFSSVTWASSNTTLAPVSVSNSVATATFKLNNEIQYSATLTPTLVHSSGNRTPTGKTVTVDPGKSLSLNTQLTISNANGSSVKWYAFKPSETGTYVFFSWFTSSSPDVNINIYQRNTSNDNEVGSSLAYGDDYASTTYGNHTGNSSSGIQDKNFNGGLVQNLLGTDFHPFYCVVSLTANQVYLAQISNLNGTSIPFKVCKAVNITFNATGGSGTDDNSNTVSTMTVPMPVDHTTMKMNQVGFTRANHQQIAWSTSGTNAQDKTCMLSATLTVPSSATTYYALWNPNDGAPTPLGLFTDYTAQINNNYEVQFYTYTPLETGTYAIFSKGSGSPNPYLILADKSAWASSATYIASDNNTGSTSHSDIVGSGSNQFYIAQELTAGTTYYIAVKLQGSGTGTYPFRIESVFKIHYDANGGSGAPADQHKFFDKPLTLSSTVPTRTGYTFLGWSTHPSATTADYPTGSTNVYNENANLTLYAVWQKNQSTLTVDPNGGVWDYYAPNGSPFTGYYQDTLSIPDPTRVGYNFANWTLSGSGNGTFNSSSKIFTFGSSTSAMTLTANWTQGSYSVTYPGAHTTGTPATASGAAALNATVTADANYHLTDNVTVKVGSKTLTRGTDYTYTLSSNHRSATVAINADLIGDSVTINAVAEACSGGTATCTQAATCATCNTTYGSADANNHDWDYAHATFNWSGYTCPNATVKCTRNASHTTTVNTTVTSEVTAAAVCNANGTKVYTAKFIANNTEYTSTKTETLTDTANHDYITVASASHLKTAATCTTAAVYYKYCSRCGANHPTETFTSGDPDANAHSWGAWTKVDDNTHKRVCANSASHVEIASHSWTAGTETPATCTEAGSTPYTCSVCSGTKTETIPALGHSFSGDWTVRTPATCTTAGEEYRVCGRTGCNAEETRAIPATGHTLMTVQEVAPRCNQAGHYSYTYCSTCKQILIRNNIDVSSNNWKTTDAEDHVVWTDATAHNWGDWTVADGDEPTCTEPGTETRTCSYCDDTETRTVAALGHNIGMVAPVNPTCQTEGNYCYTYCARCYKVLTINFADVTSQDITYTAGTTPSQAVWTDANAHNMSAFTETAAATCTEDGTLTATCQNSGCSHTETKVEPKLGHNWGDWTETTAATCTTDGVETRTCRNDSNHTETRAIPKLGHDWSNWAVQTAATCTANGTEERHCRRSDCTESETRPIPKLDHNWGNWEDLGETQGHSRTCSVGGEAETEAHDWKDIVRADALVSASSDPCAAGVSYYKSCSVCGRVSTDASNTFTTQTAGHKLVEIPAKAETCTTAGNSHYYECAVCHKFFSDSNGATEITDHSSVVIAALGHNFGTTAIEVVGGHQYECSRCHGLGDGTTLGAVESHTFDQQNTGARYVAGAATQCGETASYYYSCKCGAVGTSTFTSESGTLNHILTAHAAVAPTCVAPGRIAYWECSRCHRLFKDANGDVEVSADQLANNTLAAHSWSAYVITTDPTCTTDGIETSTCSVCGLTRTQPVGKLNHDFTGTYLCHNNGTHSVKCSRCDVYSTPVACTTTSSSTASDCQHHGVTTYHCSVCNGTWTNDDGVGDHNMTAHPATDATCTTDGNTAYWSCSVCGKFYSDAGGATEIAADSWVIAATDHAMTLNAANAASCTQPGNSAYYSCSRCGKFFSDALGQYEIAENSWVIPALGHRTAKVNAVAPTCTLGGNTVFYVCSGCGKYFSDAAAEHEVEDTASLVIAPLNHDWGDWSETTAPTCTATGVETRTCSRCGATETRDIAATGHYFNELVDTNPWTWTKSGNTYVVTATLRCINPYCNERTTRNAVVTSEAHSAATCGDIATVTFTATVTLDGGEEKTDQKTDSDVALPHNIVEVAEKAATCTESGNKSYTYCSRCYKILTLEGVDISSQNKTYPDDESIYTTDPLDHDWGTPTYTWTETEGRYSVTALVTCTRDANHTQTETVNATSSQTKDPTCTEEGETTYTATFTNPLFTTQIKKDPIAKTAHDPVRTEPVAAKCIAAGNIEYWQCATCHKYFSDANCDHEITQAQTVIAIDPTNHAGPITHNNKIEPTCVANGQKEYWHCAACNVNFAYNDNGVATALDDLTIPSTGTEHRFTVHVSAKDATCLQPGNYAYWECTTCHAKYDETKTNRFPNDDASIAALGHDFMGADAEHHPRVEATCTANGMQEYWTCARCHLYFATNNTDDTNAKELSALVIPKLGHELVAVQAVAATCDNVGNKSYTYCERCKVILVLDGVYVEEQDKKYPDDADFYTIGALGHAYGEPTWDWADDYSKATATFTCANDANHEHVVSITDSNPSHQTIIEQTHTVDGEIRYTATVTFNGQTYTDVRTQITTADGHDLHLQPRVEPTCTTAGHEAYYTCGHCSDIFIYTTEYVPTTLAAVTIPASGHNWANPTWSWTQDEHGNYTGATVTFTCTNDNCGATYQLTAAITSSIATAATCTTSGETLYTATATVPEAGVENLAGGTTFTDTRTRPIEATNHALTKHIANDATCTEGGNIEYYTCSVCNKIFREGNVATGIARYEITEDDIGIPALGHNFDYRAADIVPVWVWVEEGNTYQCTMTATCTRCDATDSETVVVDEQHVEHKIAPACETQGLDIYTAVFTKGFDTQTKDKVLDPTGHGTPVKTERVEPTCLGAGEEAYWTCPDCHKNYAEEELTHQIINPTPIPALGHDYGAPTWSWTDVQEDGVITSYTKATATFTCRREGCVEENNGYTVAVECTADYGMTVQTTTAATCETAGVATYTATAKFNGNSYSDTATAVIPALGHDFTASKDRVNQIDGDETHHNYKCVRCDAVGVMNGTTPNKNGKVECSFSGNWNIGTNETCTSAGTEWRQCEFCANREEHTRPVSAHTIISVPAQEATCQAAGNKAYSYCAVCKQLLSVDGVETIPAGTLYDSEAGILLYKTEDATAHDEKTVNAKAATCETAGNKAYSYCDRCKMLLTIDNEPVSAGHDASYETYADEYTIPALGHDFVMEGEGRQVRHNTGEDTHSFQCSRCDAYGIKDGTTQVKNGKEACYGGTAKCTEKPICSVCGAEYGAALGHNYTLVSWTWANDFTSATANFVCKNDPSHKESVNATITSVNATVTCTQAGQKIYTAKVTFEGKEYTDTKAELVDALGHDWDYANAIYEWDDAMHCTLKLKCSREGCNAEHSENGTIETQTTAATCLSGGNVRYIAKFVINDLQTYVDVPTNPLGHRYDTPAWNWTGDDDNGYTKATATFTCTRCEEGTTGHEVVVTCEPQDPVDETVSRLQVSTVDTTCEANGATTYTAIALFNGATFTDSKIVPIAKSGHEYKVVENGWHWANDYSTASVDLVCKNDPSHTATVNAVVTESSAGATCVSGGGVSYTATAVYNNQTFTDFQGVTDGKLGHDYQVSWIWTENEAEDTYTAVAVFTCQRSGCTESTPGHSFTLNAQVTKATPVPATCETAGNNTFNATVTVPDDEEKWPASGQTYTDSKVVTIPALEHDWRAPTYSWEKVDDNHYTVTAIRVCNNDPANHSQTETKSVTGEDTVPAGCTTEGVRTFTATFSNTAFGTKVKTEPIPAKNHALQHHNSVAPTCTDPGNVEYWQCTNSGCGKCFSDANGTTEITDTAIPKLGHDFVMSGSGMVAIDNGDDTHSYKCSRCDAYGAVINNVQTTREDGGKVAHDFGAWIILEESTCQNPGLQKHICKVCGCEKTAAIGVAAHQLFLVSAKAPTCTATGNSEYYECNVCHKLFTDATASTETNLAAVTIAAKGHNFTGAIHDNGDGTHSYRCVNGCGSYSTPENHVFDQENTSREYLRNYANCEEASTYYKSCACGAKGSATFTVGQALGHTMVEFPAQPATCTEAGHSKYKECQRCHVREDYVVDPATGHDEYQYDESKSGASADGSIRWEAYSCKNKCGTFYLKTTIVSIDANGTRVPNVNVRIVDASGRTIVNKKTDANGELKVGTDYSTSLHPGVTYDVYLDYVRDGGNYNTHGSISFDKNGKLSGSFGKLTPYGGNASGTTGGSPSGEFRCSMCDTYDSMKDKPVIGWFISIIHAFVHAISRIGK